MHNYQKDENETQMAFGGLRDGGGGGRGFRKPPKKACKITMNRVEADETELNFEGHI